ncbi:NAD(P)-dependent alcohol dehydrogenase [Lacihabitans soyangensis]|uniref:NAD(P)-dependent alcohol dehydrogenase n=1 Tax=Lacihabitans soyangensis TaxID=869394 RepID=A0AAE3KTV6_9BACT|nr:NAD(P)-dependent alcohol dehydrogenase [Lacihabitans soyangensis]MCP9764438.1 NAD(P)-dependent alcohol dehydrogenase [Lacihabitans soyangensis]
MKASVYYKYGNSEVLEIKEVETPQPKADEILVKVKTSTVNRTDCAMLKAKPYIMRLFTGFFAPRNPILGTDFAGIVEEVGEEIKDFKIGDRVFGFNDMGVSSHAEYLCISKKKAWAKIPENVGFENAAASLEGAHYAINFINKIKIYPNQKVLVYGASGAIGSAMVQILKSLDLKITAVGNSKSLEKLQQMGLEKVLDYEKEDFRKMDEKFDFVFDAVGKSSFYQTKHLLKSEGTYISSELGYMAQNIFLPLLTIFSGKKVKFPIPLDINASIQLISKLMKNNDFEPFIDKTYTLDQIKEVFDYADSGKKTGNLVICFP